jgi:hypothetical protein
VPLAEAYAMAMNGEITDALAIVGLARAWQHLHHGRISPVSGTLPALPRVVSDERKSDR